MRRCVSGPEPWWVCGSSSVVLSRQLEPFARLKAPARQRKVFHGLLVSESTIACQERASDYPLGLNSELLVSRAT